MSDKFGTDLAAELGSPKRHQYDRSRGEEVSLPVSRSNRILGYIAVGLAGAVS